MLADMKAAKLTPESMAIVLVIWLRFFFTAFVLVVYWKLCKQIRCANEIVVKKIWVFLCYFTL